MIITDPYILLAWLRWQYQRYLLLKLDFVLWLAPRVKRARLFYRDECFTIVKPTWVAGVKMQVGDSVVFKKNWKGEPIQETPDHVVLTYTQAVAMYDRGWVSHNGEPKSVTPAKAFPGKPVDTGCYFE